MKGKRKLVINPETMKKMPGNHSRPLLLEDSSNIFGQNETTDEVPYLTATLPGCGGLSFGVEESKLPPLGLVDEAGSLGDTVTAVENQTYESHDRHKVEGRFKQSHSMVRLRSVTETAEMESRRKESTGL